MSQSSGSLEKKATSTLGMPLVKYMPSLKTLQYISLSTRECLFINYAKKSIHNIDDSGCLQMYAYIYMPAQINNT